MNYGELLYKAHENNKNATHKSVPCYKTSFSAPKKMERPTVSSENIKRFLARKENEEKIKALEAKRKKEELLALRSQDKKAQKRVQVMLKRTKSANKSVMEDAIDNINTRDTLEGPMQCDEDDYGYVSQEASAFYMKMINKYENQPSEPSLFSKSKKEVKDLAAAKDRVKAALRKEEEESELPHKRKKKRDEEEEEEKVHKDKRSQNGSKLNEKIKNHEKKYEEKKEEKKKVKRPPPPAINFDQLLKLAEVKQHQPIMIDTSAQPKEPERLMTEKEKAEFLKEEERKRNRGKRPPPTPSTSEKIPKKPVEPKKTKTEPERKVPNKYLDHIENEKLKSSKPKPAEKPNLPSKYEKALKSDLESAKIEKSKKIPEKTKVDSVLSDIDREIELLKRKRMLLASNTKSHQEYKPSMPSEKPKQIDRKPNSRPIQRERPMQERRKLPPVNKAAKRRIDSDSEYDSELEDFIDDGPEEEQDYSKYISEIFGYDKSKYANVDDDDECMESNFAQQMKEEFVSTKIGILEDLEDIRKEQEEKKRMKDRLKKKKLK